MEVEKEKQRKEFPERGPVLWFKGSKEDTVLANLFNISVKERLRVYKYRIEIKKVIASKDNEVDLTKGPKNDYAIQNRRRVLNSLWYDLIAFTKRKKTPIVTDKYNSVYDCANVVYSRTRLIPEEEAMLQFKMPMDAVTSDNSKRLLGKACSEILYTLTPTIKFDFSVAGEMARESLQFLEILTSALLVKNGRHFIFKNKFYGKSSTNEVTLNDKNGSVKVIKKGFVKNCRIGEFDSAPVALLQIDAKASPFFLGSALTVFATKFFGMSDPRDLERLDDKKICALLNQLRGVVVRTTHTNKEKARTFAIKTICSLGAEECIKFERDGIMIDMCQYFESRYTTTIYYRKIPVIEECLFGGKSYYPMEHLEIVEGQRVTNQKLSSDILKMCRMVPGDRYTVVEEAMTKWLLGSENPFLQAFGVSLEKHWQRAPAVVLHPPTIVYSSNTRVECRPDGSWSHGSRFIKGGEISTFMFIVFDECAREDRVKLFIKAITKKARYSGVLLNEESRIEYCRSESEDRLTKLFERMMKEKSPFIMGLTKGDKDDVHGILKKLEASTGVVTQHITLNTFETAIGGSKMVLNNLVAKMNLKAQGINHSLELSRHFTTVNKGPAFTDQNKRLLPKHRMFIGLDVSHAGALSFADRQLGCNRTVPSVVGMSYTMRGPTEMRGTYWLQQPGAAKISQLELNMGKALCDYYDEMKHLPDDIVIYRGGVSEGEYATVIEEVKEMKLGFRHVSEHFKPTVQCIIVQTSSNYRVIPESGGQTKNVLPGTVVDNVITNPKLNEFILVAQKGIVGTVCPIKCVIAYNEKGSTGSLLTFDDTKLLTHLLCHGHQVVTGSTTLPCLLTAATNLSKRGMNNWKNISNRRPNDEDFSEISEAIDSKIKHHYWA